MPQKLFDADGNEVEAFTADEIETQKQEALDKYMEEHPDQSSQITQLNDKIKQAEEDLRKATEADMSEGQKERLRQAREDAQTELKEFKDTTMERIKGLEETILGTPKKTMLEKLSKGNVELKQKIEHFYDQFKGDPRTPEEIEQRMIQAATLAGAAPKPGFMDNMSGTGGRGEHQTHDVPTQETDNSKMMRKALGISDKEVESFTKAQDNQ